MENENNSAAQALSQIIELLSRLDDESRTRVLKSVSTFFHTSVDFDTPVSTRTGATALPPQTSRPAFSDDLSPSPKHFMFEKQPQTDVERVACLAYYLTHFRDTPHFKTLDIAKLNTEAAQPKFSNATYAVNNATNSGYLAGASKSTRQITAAGEQFVMAMPDRAAAKASMSQARKKALSRKRREKAE